MEELIDRLRELNEPVPVPLELPDADVLVEVQEQILIHIPYELKEFLLSVSDVVYGHLEPVTVCDPQSHTYLPEVTAQAWDAGMPRWLVPLCVDGPQVYAVDPDGRVLLWEEGSEEAGGELGEWDSVWHWVHEVWLEGDL